MANKIDEVWYAYNAKGQKIPPYKSSYKNRRPRTLIGRVWQMFKENWIGIISTMFIGGLIMYALIYAMLQLFS
tara:strand:- start:15 stop:233 length:219 start_codon:yes stop_codon:yes gene_type:complete